MIKMSIKERAKQFAPFASLRGYGKMLNEKTFVPSIKKEITEERANFLNEIIFKLKKGDIVKITYYEKDGYIIKEGAVTGIDLVFKNIEIVKQKVDFNDIYELTLLGEI